MTLSVRQMTLDETNIRIDYFLSASNEYLAILGVDPSKLPSRDDWRMAIEQDYQLPLEKRKNIYLVWLLADKPVGFSSVDSIEFGIQANMHLHLLNAGNRNKGIGVKCVEMSAALYFDLLNLERLYCQPNAFNIAPNRTLQKAGFKFVKTYMDRPSPINTYQAINQWAMSRS